MPKVLTLQDLALRLASLAKQGDPQEPLRIDLGDGIVKDVTTSDLMIDDEAVIRLSPESMKPSLT